MAIGQTNVPRSRGPFVFKYTGAYSVTGEYKTTSTGYIIPKGDFSISLLTSGTLTVKRAENMDVHLVGGGAGGSSGRHGQNGGSGGYTATYLNQAIAKGEYPVVIGAGGNGLDNRSYYYSKWDVSGNASSAFGLTANGATNETVAINEFGVYVSTAPSNGGSGGGKGAWYERGGDGGTNGGNGRSAAGDRGGYGQGRITCDFNDSSLTRRAGGGGGGSPTATSQAELPGYGGSGGGGDGGWNQWEAQNGTVNYGGGGGGGRGYGGSSTCHGGNGGSGIVIIRNARS